MGMLTDSMTKLRGQIEMERSNRTTFIRNLKDNVKQLKDSTSEMQSNCRNNHSIMSKKMKADQETFLSNMKLNVSNMLTAFNNNLTEMSKTSRGQRSTFLLNLKSDVANLKALTGNTLTSIHNTNSEMFRATKKKLLTRVLDIRQQTQSNLKEMANDLSTARQIWSGAESVKSQNNKELLHQTKKTTEQPAKKASENYKETSGHLTKTDHHKESKAHLPVKDDSYSKANSPQNSEIKIGNASDETKQKKTLEL